MKFVGTRFSQWVSVVNGSMPEGVDKVVQKCAVGIVRPEHNWAKRLALFSSNYVRHVEAQS